MTKLELLVFSKQTLKKPISFVGKALVQGCFVVVLDKEAPVSEENLLKAK